MIHMGDLEIRSISQRLPDNLRQLAKRHMYYTILHSINTGELGPVMLNLAVLSCELPATNC